MDCCNCKQEHLIDIQNKYKYEMLNIINENVNIETDKLNDLTDELYKQQITILANGHNSERILIGALLYKNTLLGPMSSLNDYVFKSSNSNVVAIYILKLGPNPSNDYFILYNDSGIVHKVKISTSNININIIPSLYNLITRNVNIEIFRLYTSSYSNNRLDGDISPMDDGETAQFKNIFYHFTGFTKYTIFMDTYNDNYGFKFSTWTHYM